MSRERHQVELVQRGLHQKVNDLSTQYLTLQDQLERSRSEAEMLIANKGWTSVF